LFFAPICFTTKRFLANFMGLESALNSKPLNGFHIKSYGSPAF